jgi:hypothetical protein
MTRRSGRSALDSEALIESFRANIPLNVLLQHDRLRGADKASPKSDMVFAPAAT